MRRIDAVIIGVKVMLSFRTLARWYFGCLTLVILDECYIFLIFCILFLCQLSTFQPARRRKTRDSLPLWLLDVISFIGVLEVSAGPAEENPVLF